MESLRGLESKVWGGFGKVDSLEKVLKKRLKRALIRPLEFTPVLVAFRYHTLWNKDEYKKCGIYGRPRNCEHNSCCEKRAGERLMTDLEDFLKSTEI